MSNKLYVFLIFNFFFSNAICNEENTGHQMDPHTDFNKEHLKEDLDGVIDKKPEEMTNDELQFHYFRQHDYDKDNSLDGNEIVMSLLHHAKDAPDGANPFNSDDQLSSIVDDVLKQQDKNNDGKISFQEYIIPFQQNDKKP